MSSVCLFCVVRGTVVR